VCGIVFFKKPYIPQIYDCFPFFNELELLEVRLNELYDHVDKFVIVECTESYRGKPKPLHYAENKHCFEKFADKIIHIVVSEHFENENPWKREHFQRQQIMRGLKNCHNSDIIFLSDLDEIVKANRIKEITDLITSAQVQAVLCRQKMYCGFINRYRGIWPGTVCASYREFKKRSIKKIRRLRNNTPRALRKARISKTFCMQDAGWHFNSMGGTARFITKLESFSHKNLDVPGFDKAKHLVDIINPLPRVAVDESFPSYIVNNKKHFEEIGFIDNNGELYRFQLNLTQ
jgi:beta-1,4-mannosyl-glycoprotein beta-1,4-N-acetylglucosaminyltransferase